MIPECEDALRRYLHQYHERSWWEINHRPHDVFIIVYAFVEGWKSAVDGSYVEITKDQRKK